MEAIGKDLRSQLHFTGEITEAQQREKTSKISRTQWPAGRIPRTLSRAPGPACWLCPDVSKACLHADLPLVLPQGHLPGPQPSLRLLVEGLPTGQLSRRHGLCSSGAQEPLPRAAGHTAELSRPPCRGRSTHLDIFRRFLSSALAFWAEVRLSASARLSTAMARKTLSRMSECIWLRSLGFWWRGASGRRPPYPPTSARLNLTPLVQSVEFLLPELPHRRAWAQGHRHISGVGGLPAQGAHDGLESTRIGHHPFPALD